MTKAEFISTLTGKAKITPAAAARVAEAIFDADDGAILDALGDDAHGVATNGRRPRRNGRERTGFEGLTETEIRAKLIEGFDKVRGIHIDDVFGRLR